MGVMGIRNAVIPSSAAADSPLTAADISDALARGRRRSNCLFVLKNIYIGLWECDIFSVTQSGYMDEYEVKISKYDYLQDFQKNNGAYTPVLKHEVIQSGHRTNRFWFVLPENLIPDIVVPEYVGLISAIPSYRKIDGHREVYFNIIKDAPVIHKNKLFDNPQLLKEVAIRAYSKIPVDLI